MDSETGVSRSETVAQATPDLPSREANPGRLRADRRKCMPPYWRHTFPPAKLTL
nr:MAG TPA: hypothetical protein [Caudoviricetes sp.]